MHNWLISQSSLECIYKLLENRGKCIEDTEDYFEKFLFVFFLSEACFFILLPSCRILIYSQVIFFCCMTYEESFSLQKSIIKCNVILFENVILLKTFIFEMRIKISTYNLMKLAIKKNHASGIYYKTLSNTNNIMKFHFFTP